MTVRNVVSNGGSGRGRNFRLKDDTIGGNLVVQGWSGLWFGLIRSMVGGQRDRGRDVRGGPNTVRGRKIGECAGL